MGRVKPRSLAGAPDDWFEAGRRRVVMIANDERLSPDVAARLELGPSDVLVQFNKLMHHDRFARLACHKVLVFQKNAHDSHWGFSTDGVPLVPFLDQSFATLTLAFTKTFAPAVVPFVEGLPAGVVALRFNPATIPLFAVPEGKVASVGYNAASVFHHLNLVRMLDGLEPWPILTVGFTGAYAKPKQFQGHDFAFEQANLSVWPDLTRLDFEGEPMAAEWGPLSLRRRLAASA